MRSSARTIIAPAYLFACIVLGGSAQGVWFNMALQLVGVALIAWAAMARGEEEPSTAARQLLWLAIAAVVLVSLQLIPLPGALWSSLGPRARLAHDFATLGLRVPSEPLSLAPGATLSSLLSFIPPLALVCVLVRLRAHRQRALAAALIGATLLAIMLGALQVASTEQSHWYLYADTNGGKAVGFFANADHMATLLVITIPFLAATAAAARTSKLQRRSAIQAVCAGMAVVVIVGIALNGSLAGYGLSIPMAAGSLLILLPRSSRLRPVVVAGAVILLIAAVIALQSTPIGSGAVGGHAATAAQARTEILATTSKAIQDFLPWGSGLGTFRPVYQLYEDPTQVTTVFVVHAHNDYAEVLLELGVAGALLMLVFLAWWATAVWRVWRSAQPRPFARAAALASTAILLHSFVDFPLRTAAISACFAVCLALLADGRSAAPAERAALRRKRHVEFK